MDTAFLGSTVEQSWFEQEGSSQASAPLLYPDNLELWEPNFGDWDHEATPARRGLPRGARDSAQRKRKGEDQKAMMQKAEEEWRASHPCEEPPKKKKGRPAGTKTGKGVSERARKKRMQQAEAEAATATAAATMQPGQRLAPEATIGVGLEQHPAAQQTVQNGQYFCPF
ncbi:hypothetical protein P280DRAFT_475474 [Massarina eburnea CBS 473.64]|uniref:Uncharacterized protein n=1 Tax=Massarina eburnea CBS 473.64 TaxID=1395130 RepID=A0A6A6SJP9_9PLEO|nr:hypothetical protein P280DRAFT_475474 [Massarina eburnea CBS 473.64]